MEIEYDEKLKNFSKLSLTELNSTASFLKRIDAKFLLTNSQLYDLLDDFKDDFNILEISGIRIFSYDNIYMDTPNYFFYNQHENQEKSRTKIRTRHYVDSNLAFFEYKQKENGVTRKFRYQFPTEELGKMTKGKTRFFEGVWQSVYEGTTAPILSPSIKTNYKRITLVSKIGEERLTIDFDIKTQNLRGEQSKEKKLTNLVIIESKSLSKNCNSLNIIKKHGIQKANSCSKYSLGVIYSGLTDKFNTFKNTIKKIKEIRLTTLKNRFRKTSLNSLIKKEVNEENESVELKESVIK